MDRNEYVIIPYCLIPKEIIDQYQLDKLVAPFGNVYFKVHKGMYGLPQASLIAYKQLKSHLGPAGYSPCHHTPGLWKHETCNILFCLVVEYFGVEYVDKTDAEHLVMTLQEKYKTSLDWDSKFFCGITLTWDYKNQTCTLSMPGYVLWNCIYGSNTSGKTNHKMPHICGTNTPMIQRSNGLTMIDPLSSLRNLRCLFKPSLVLSYSTLVPSTQPCLQHSMPSPKTRPTQPRKPTKGATLHQLLHHPS